MQKSLSHYETLGVAENATKEDIKRAFHKLSLKYHPDRNPNNQEAYEKFQKINNAYEVLGDEQKRREYDSGFGDGGIDINDLLSSLFQGQGPTMQQGPMGNPFIHPMFMGGLGGLGGPGGVKVHVFNAAQMPPFFHAGAGMPFPNEKPPAIQHELRITLSQVYTGDKVPIEIERIIANQGKEKELMYITIPKGIDDGEIIVLKDKGHVHSEAIKGDVKIYVKIDNTTEFTRSGLDLLYQKSISLKEALCGFSFALKHLNGKTYTLTNGAGNIVSPNYKKVISGMGLERDDHYGKLEIQFDVQFPKELSNDMISKLKELL